MNKTVINYANKKVYVGLDVHKKSISIAVWFEGEIIKRATMAPDGIKLVESLRNWFQGAKIFTAYEAGFSGFGLHRILVQHDIDNIVVNAASVEVAANDKKKTDRRDANKLAEQRAAQRLHGIYVPTVEEELRRQITRTRDQIAKEKRRVSNKIKGKLHYFGYIAPDNEAVISEKYVAWIESLDLANELRLTLNLLIEEWRLFCKQLEGLKVDLQVQSFEDPYTEEVYRSVPGVGAISARILANELGDLSKRFKNQDGVFQYTGLTPSEYSSGEHVCKGHIDRQGSSRIRHILILIAWKAIKMDGALKEAFERIAHRRGKKRAIVAIARKLIGRMRACFAHQQGYELGLVS